jgi:ParB/RepB/Spo0J family partition protein
MDMCIQQIPLGEIDIPDSQRALAHLEELMASIQEVGLLQAIWVTPRGIRYRVIFGGRRLMACKRLGWSEIPAVVLKMDDLHAELATIDENLVRQELTLLERSEQLSRKKETDFSVLHQNRPPMRLSRRWSMKVRETKKAFDLDLLGRHG